MIPLNDTSNNRLSVGEEQLDSTLPEGLPDFRKEMTKINKTEKIDMGNISHIIYYESDLTKREYAISAYIGQVIINSALEKSN